MKMMIYIVLIVIILVIIWLYFKKNKTEKLIFSKNQFILNDKYLYDLKNNEFDLTITKIDLMIDKNLKYSALIDLKLRIDNKFEIKNLYNGLKILKKLKEYNKEKFNEFIESHFSDEYIIKIIEKEIENGS
ncbi:hypothetical protein [Oceanivirga salmonicida]|uniref:hypothetical protein n=2 Tax=Oceanivirga salmonicida TaxID=1769291 RepID=UPI0012E20B48|nr:hypothetical protein [Oceanivirga salmonicida]